LKKSFAMLFAIIFIIVLGTVGGLMLYLSVQNTQSTADDYLNVQVRLEAKSATEFAIMALESRDFKNDGCINKMDINSTLFDVNITFYYFLTECLSDCNCSVITTQDSNGSVIINTYVTSKVDSRVRFFRQTIQKP